MSRADDLTPLFRKASNTGNLEFRQGIIVAWDSSTGANQVDVGGTVLVDVPCLNIGDFVVLQPGDVVGIQKVQNTYFILGRIQLPGPPDANRAVVDTDIQDEVNISFAQQTTYGTKVTVNIPLPVWIREGDEIAIGATFVVSSRNQGASTPSDPSILQPRIQFLYGGATLNTTNPAIDVGLNRRAQATALGSLNIAGWSGMDPGETITVNGQSQMVGGTNWSTDTAAVAILLTNAVFRRTQ